MQLRLLFTLGLVTCLVTIAFSNECLRQHRHAAQCRTSSGSGNNAAGGNNAAAGEQAAEKTTNPDNPTNGEYSTLLVNKLLYI